MILAWWFGPSIGRGSSSDDLHARHHHAEPDPPRQQATVPAADATLIAQVVAGDTAAFERMYTESSAGLYRYLGSLVHDHTVAEELVQETFVRVWFARTTLRQDLPWRGYVFSTARNAALQYLRNRRTTHVMQARVAREAVANPEMGTSGMGTSTPLADATLTRREDLFRLDAVIERLPDRMREAFRLRWQGGLSYRDIAQTLGISIRTVEHHLARALQLVREKMSNDD